MKKYLLLAAASFSLLPSAVSASIGTEGAPAPEPAAAPQSVRGVDTVTTGVAKARDRLDSATSTSVLREAEIVKLAPKSIGELLRDIPGLRSEAAAGEGTTNLTIRGLPIASSGAKFVQLQEDGLPVLEFGDIQGSGAEAFLRADLNLAQVDVIRGGSASTFASNSPGGIINFVSKTGEVDGGAIAVTAGLDFDQYRTDFDYGARLTDSVRFHVGGFYRQGEGPRRTGYDAQKGGQIKANVTKEFTGGYIRLYGKYLDDRTPFYDAVPFRVTGSNNDPKIATLPGFDGRHDTALSRNIRTGTLLDGKNAIAAYDLADGQRVKALSLGLEAQVDLSGWTVTERFRFANMSGNLTGTFTSSFLPAAAGLQALGGTGATLRYANGPQAGQVIADPSALNGNGVLVAMNILNLRQNSLNNVTNDVRASRVWPLGHGDLTTTAGFYAARQTIDYDPLWSTVISDLRGDGRAALLDITDRNGRALTQNGVYAYTLAFVPGTRRRSPRVDYAVNAPFASVNYHIGRVAVGASIRYDYGSAEGQIFGSDLGGGRIGIVSRDMNGDGVISVPEQKVGMTPLGTPAPVDYRYDYLSYSGGINFRIAEPLAVFARYSRGARANADRILFTDIVSTTTGGLLNPKGAADPVKQAEAGVKYRRADLTLNLTGFWAKAHDTNVDTVTSTTISRDYKAMGLEFEGGFRTGPFGLTAGATYTDAEIVRDEKNPAIVGNTPRHQAKFIFQATPQITTDRFAVGAVLIGTTRSYAQDTNVLRVPGFVTTNAFLQFRPAPRLQLTLNATNLFDVKAFTTFDEAAIPASGIVRGRLLSGRNTSLTARLDF